MSSTFDVTTTEKNLHKMEEQLKEVLMDFNKIKSYLNSAEAKLNTLKLQLCSSTNTLSLASTDSEPSSASSKTSKDSSKCNDASKTQQVKRNKVRNSTYFEPNQVLPKLGNNGPHFSRRRTTCRTEVNAKTNYNDAKVLEQLTTKPKKINKPPLEKNFLDVPIQVTQNSQIYSPKATKRSSVANDSENLKRLCKSSCVEIQLVDINKSNNSNQQIENLVSKESKGKTLSDRIVRGQDVSKHAASNPLPQPNTKIIKTAGNKLDFGLKSNVSKNKTIGETIRDNLRRNFDKITAKRKMTISAPEADNQKTNTWLRGSSPNLQNIHAVSDDEISVTKSFGSNTSEESKTKCKSTTWPLNDNDEDFLTDYNICSD